MIRIVGADGEITESMTESLEDSEDDSDSESRPNSRRSSNASESSFQLGEIVTQGKGAAGSVRPPHITVFTDTLEGAPEIDRDIAEFEDRLPDGTLVQRKVVYIYLITVVDHK